MTWSLKVALVYSIHHKICFLGHVNELIYRLNDFANKQNIYSIDHFVYFSVAKAVNFVFDTLIKNKTNLFDANINDNDVKTN